MDNQNSTNENLLRRLNELERKQDALNVEIYALKAEVKGKETVQAQPTSVATPQEIVKTESAYDPWVIQKPKDSILKRTLKNAVPKEFTHNIEKFVGENLISVIGIVILIIGVGIGAKYAIDNKMISPLTRIIIGYIISTALLVFAIKLKAKYEKFSAVLLSGALALMYFLTFAAYDFYDLIPKMMAFGLMLVFTLFTTFASIKYNRQVIAHIGFVGAYAVPILLSDGTGDVVMLLTYVTIINFGILAVSVKKYWKSLYYTAFVLTWVVYLTAYESKLDATDDLGILLTFLAIYYLTFYLVFIAYKLIQKEAFKRLDIFLLMANSSVFYGLGYSILSETQVEGNFLGLFTLINAIIHFAFAAYIHKQKLADRKLFYLIIVLVLTFITIAIPVQLNGHWVTLLWIGEAALLFWIGRTKQIPMYEKIALPLMFIAFGSILQDWDDAYTYMSAYTREGWLTPFLNFQFLSGIIMVVGFGLINYINQNVPAADPLFKKKAFNNIINIVMPAFFLITLYLSFSMEISNYWNQQYYGSGVQIAYEDGSGETHQELNYSLKSMGGVWSYIYTLGFFTVLSFINYKYLKIRILGIVNLSFNAFVLVMFLFSGLYLLSELRINYLAMEMSDYFTYGWFYIGIRYVSLVFVGALLYVSYQYIKQEFMRVNLKQLFALFFYATVLWLLSSELIHWMEYAGSTQSYKLGLSILWGVYALSLIVIGIIRKYKQLRIGAMGLFAITLGKLFFYDISHLNTIAKTIVFVVLGILLLVISFLYNKYKHLIFNEPQNKKQ
ncbi:MAG: DUF2339 domain-containing protein [Cyclobacteriaceae bacterium]|nr:DUF2339 domain-containing protein [Cyclobacteriaceae bacterium]